MSAPSLIRFRWDARFLPFVLDEEQSKLQLLIRDRLPADADLAYRLRGIRIEPADPMVPDDFLYVTNLSEGEQFRFELRGDSASYEHRVPEPEDMSEHLLATADPFLRLVFDCGEERTDAPLSIPLERRLVTFGYAFESRLPNTGNGRARLVKALPPGLVPREGSKGGSRAAGPRPSQREPAEELGRIELRSCLYQTIPGWEEEVAVWLELKLPPESSESMTATCVVRSSDRLGRLPRAESAARLRDVYEEFYRPVIADGVFRQFLDA